MKRKIFFACLIILVLSACSPETPSAEMPTLDATVLNQTAVSRVTADFVETQTRVPTETPTRTSTSTPIPTIDRTRPSMNTPTGEIPCNQAAPGQPFDVTIPDDTRMSPGQPFSKTWRLENIGSCTWTRQYAVTFFSGNSLSAQYTQYLQQPIEPGDVVDVTVDMVAPQTVGLYQSNWMLSDPDGQLFGIGPHGDAPFWVRIGVVQIETNTPTPTITPTPVVFVTDEVNLGDGDQLDLDTGTLNPNDESEADLIYEYGGSPTHLLTPANGTKWAVHGETTPNLADCTKANLTENAFSFNEVPDGTYLCYRTSEVLRGWLKIEGFTGGKLSISFLTWAAP